jgi:hypothetical protein
MAARCAIFILTASPIDTALYKITSAVHSIISLQMQYREVPIYIGHARTPTHTHTHSVCFLRSHNQIMVPLSQTDSYKIYTAVVVSAMQYPHKVRPSCFPPIAMKQATPKSTVTGPSSLPNALIKGAFSPMGGGGL